jgi:hypothetical protein
MNLVTKQAQKLPIEYLVLKQTNTQLSFLKERPK